MYTRLNSYIKERSDNELRGYIIDCKRNLEYIICKAKKIMVPLINTNTQEQRAYLKETNITYGVGFCRHHFYVVVFVLIVLLLF